MLNDLFVDLTNLSGKFLATIHFDKYIRAKNDVRCVFYHGVGEGKSPCMRYLDDEVSQSVFVKHLDYLQKKYILLSYDDIIALINKGDFSSNKPYCNISFDDGLYTVYSKAFPLLRERAIPFDVFLNTSVIGNKGLLWLHLLNYLFSSYGFEAIVAFLNEYCDIDGFELFKDELDVEVWIREHFEFIHNAALLEKLIGRFGLNVNSIASKQNLYLSQEQIAEMSCCGGGFYSHTHRHFPLNAFLSENVIKEEIESAYNIVKSGNDTNDSFVSFPFGMQRDYGKKSIQYAIAAGHKYVVEVGDGVNTPERIIGGKLISRVCLGSVSEDKASIYSAIEVRPVIKNRIKKLIL